MTNTEKLHQAYHLYLQEEQQHKHHHSHEHQHSIQSAENLYKEVNGKQLDTAADLQIYGYLALELGDWEKAVKALQQSAKKNGKDAQTFLLLGIAYRRLKEYSKAIHAFRNALKVHPDFVDAIYNLGISLDDHQEYEKAIDVLERGLEIAPKDTDLLNAIAGASASAAYSEDAIDYYREAITLEVDFAPFQYNLAQVLLQIGEWEEGWRLFDSRLSFRNTALNPETDAPFWKGETLEGKSILVWNEQGFGDTLQFVRYALQLKEKRGAKVYLRVQPALERLLKQNLEGMEILTSKSEFPPIDFQIPIMSLPQYFGGQPFALSSNLFSITPPLSSNSYFPSTTIQKIGLVWAGNPNHPDDSKRSIAPRLFAPLLKLKKTAFYSLQIGERAKKMNQPKITDLSASIEDFADTAALIEKLDLVISVDTAVAHLAASMNKPTWLLLDAASDWRWGLEEKETVWYASIRIFRQEKAGDWFGVMKKVSKKLKKNLLK